MLEIELEFMILPRIRFFLKIFYNVLTPNFGKNWCKNSPNPLFSSRIHILCTYIYFFYDNGCPRIGNLSKCIP